MDIVVLMSGGIDSSVAALLLKEEGHSVMGVTLDMHPLCKGNIDKAKEIADILRIEHVTLDVRKEFEESVIEYLIAQYRNGKTPNPCAVCNRQIKFGVAMDRLKFDKFATGHYARICFENEWTIKKGTDPEKDQSYFLAMIDRKKLKDLMFPVGNLTKDNVNKIAVDFGISGRAINESQDLCFAERGYSELMGGSEDERPGDIVDMKGRVIGRHRGLSKYTIGQRKGIGRPDRYPFYVVRIDSEHNRLIIGRNEDLYYRVFFIDNPNWLIEEPPVKPIDLEVKIRYRHMPVRAKFYPNSNRVEFGSPQRAITPGQVAAFYSDEILLGCGWISSIGEFS